jgi:hypothetical protein
MRRSRRAPAVTRKINRRAAVSCAAQYLVDAFDGIEIDALQKLSELAEKRCGNLFRRTMNFEHNLFL